MQNQFPASILPPEEENIEDDSSIYIQKFINKAFGIWPWLLVSVIITTGIAFLYFKTSTPIYTASAIVLVQDDKKGADFGEANLLQDFGLLMGKSNVDNELEIFKSRTLMEGVVTDLQLNVKYFIEGKVKKKEVYLNRPITLRFLGGRDGESVIPAEYSVKVDEKRIGCEISEGENKAIYCKLGDTVRLKSGVAIIEPGNALYSWQNSELLYISVATVDAVTKQYMGALSAGVPNKLVSVINLSLRENLPEKAELVLNKLIDVYLQANVNDKGRMADSTVKFIDERLKLVFKELSGIEQEIEGFKTSNKLTDVGEQAKLLLENTSEYAKQQTAQEVQLSVVKELETFLKNNIANTRVIPTSLVMQDANFIALVQQYNQLQAERDRLLMSQTSEHPAVLAMGEQLKELRLELLGSITSIKRGIEISIKELQGRTSAFENQITRVPAKERVFLDYSRQQAIKQELYLFLLKKREETAISKSSTVANARIIDSAKANPVPISPRRNKILMIGFVLGLIIPFGVSYGRDFLNNKVSSTEDIASYTKVPILGEIGHNSEKKVIVIDSTTKTIIAEQFRTLRTSLQYVLPTEEKKLLMITSSMSGEGKSFLSINLCSALALAGKKVILLELDLRRPEITQNLKLQAQGFTNYIVSRDNNWQRWVQASGVHENFSVLSSGPLPPNPSELLMLTKVRDFFNELKDHYNYIIVDTAPVGLVTDAQIIANYIDLTLYVVRHHFTYKQQLKMVERFFRKGSLPRMNIVVNDIQFKKLVYGYEYNYTYNAYGYGEDVKK